MYIYIYIYIYVCTHIRTYIHLGAPGLRPGAQPARPLGGGRLDRAGVIEYDVM